MDSGDGEIQVPEYFLCPISLQIMEDPVTTISGITYDRRTIEQWLTAASSCPVTKQPLPSASDLTPNHMLRKIIKAWCIANGRIGFGPIQNHQSPLHPSLALKLIRDVNHSSNNLLNLIALKKLEEFCNDSGINLNNVVEAGIVKAIVSFLVRRFRDAETLGIDYAMRILQLSWRFKFPDQENWSGDCNMEFVQSILWILNSEIENHAKTVALEILKTVIEITNRSLVERLEPQFFAQLVQLMRKNTTSVQSIRLILQILIKTCPSGRNKTKIVEAGAIFELIEMELGKPEKKTTELVFYLLAQLCSCADGRQQFLKHAGGIAVVAKRLLRVSASTDDRAVCILESIARSSGTREVVAEMLRVGGVSKLCMVLQAECGGYLKKKAREILRLHSMAWSNSPCVHVYLLTRDPR